MDRFIKYLNSNSPRIVVDQLNSVGVTSFSYLGHNIQLEVTGSDKDNIIIQTWFGHSKKAPAAAAQVAKFNAFLQKQKLGCKLTFRNMNQKHVFRLTTKTTPEKFRNVVLQHMIEHFLEMTIELNNIINVNDVKTVDKVQLTSIVGAGQ